MRGGSQLFQKAIVLVAVPFVFEAVIVAFLLNLLHESELEALKQEKGKRLAVRANHLLACMNNAVKWKIVSIEGFGHGSALDFRVAQEIARTFPIFNEMRAIGSNDPIMLKDLNAMEVMVRKVARLMDLSREEGYNNGKTIRLAKILNALRIGLEQFEIQQERLLMHARTIEKESTDALSESRQRTKVALCALLGVGALISVVLAVYFHKGTVSRINVLLANAQLFKEEKALQAAVPGKDEIAVLDAAFHDMAETVSESAKRERDIVRNAHDVICSLSEELLFTKVNPASQTLWGLAPEELVGRSLFEFTPADEAPRIRESALLVKGKLEGGSFEAKIRHANSYYLDMLWSVNWSEAERSFFCVCHDISEQKKIEQLKKDFVAMISHDLRTPLTSIKLMLGMLESGMMGELPEKAMKSVTRESKNVDYLIALINQLLEIEKLESGNIQLDKDELSFGEIFNQTKAALEVLAERAGVTLLIDDSYKTVVEADKQRITQVLMNLVSNAIKFSPKGSSITMRTEKQGEEQIKIAVQDQGRGIPEHAIAKVFDRFQQVERDDAKVKGGSGLGLSICKAVVEAHRGKIGVDSQEGVGSTFWFIIPLDDDCQAPALEVPSGLR